MAMLETPSRILRRIEALEAQDSDLPSLPSFPAFDDSGIQSLRASTAHSLSPKDLQTEDDEDDEPVPYQSTPAPISSHITRSTMRPPASTSSSATRFAHSMRTSMSTARRSHSQQDSFEVSEILPTQAAYDSSSSASIPDVYLPPEDENIEYVEQMHEQIAETAAFHSVNRSHSPHPFVSEEQHRTPSSKKYDYSVSLRSEPKPSPLSLNRNVSIRKPLLSRTRTPSLSRTTPSPTSMSSNSTPRSNYSALERDVLSPVPSRGTSSPAPSTNDPLNLDVNTLQDYAPSQVDVGEDAGALADSHITHYDPASIEEFDHETNRDELEHEQIQSQSQTQDDPQELPEPTFSSEEQEHVLSQSSSGSGSNRARTPFPNAFSSPVPVASNTSTPTPHYAPRDQNAVIDATATPASGPSRVADDLTTPYNRRRSFLLSLVHSTTRPRMTFPTPHPLTHAVPTPRPGPRAHPLSQAWTPSPAYFNLHPRPHPSSGSGSGSSHSHSPHDRLSFISTASSHDLTVHPRANASFDPVMGAKGVGRFNAVKLNTYLHGLNRRLQEENEMLVSRLRMHGEEVEMGKVAEQLELEMKREGFKGVDVEEAVFEEVEAMRDELDRCVLERDAMKVEGEISRRERDELKNELNTEREERKRDKERWKERMAEVQSGVEGVIKELERRLEEAERDVKRRIGAEERAHKLEERCLALEDDLNATKCRAEKAEDALASSSDLGAEVKQAYQQTAEHQEKGRVAQDRADQLERMLQDAKHRETALRASSEDQLAELDAELRQSLEAQQSAEAHALELEAEAKAAEVHVEALEDELREEAAENEDIRGRLEGLEAEAARAAEAARQMEDALEESERKMIADGEELECLRTKVARVERELEMLRERERERSQSVAAASTSFADSARTRERTALELDAEHGQLEAELDDAHREIGRLNHLLSESPSRKAIHKAKDVRIELLEKEKDELTERMRALAATMLASSSSPEKMDERSPAPHRQIMAWRTPKTPGPPLKDFSWLHEKTALPSTSPLVAQIEHLQQELHLANDSIDEKVNRLEEAGMGIVGLTERLEDARARSAALEKEVGRLVRREERWVRRLERFRCLKCGCWTDLNKLISIPDGDRSSVEQSSMSLLSDPPTPPSKTTEALKSSLSRVTSELHTLRSQWDAERKQLLGKNAVLQDAANRLNAELGAAKGEAKRALEDVRHEIGKEAKVRTNVQKELGKAKSVVDDLEDALENERSRLRALSTEQDRMTREKDGILVQLQRAQSDMDDVGTQLEKVKRDNRTLEAELRVTATVDQKARLLEAKVSENHDVIEHLRDERETLIADHATLQRRYVEASAQVNHLRQELSSSQLSHDEHRYQLDLRVNEIEELRRELSEQARELERIESEKNQARADRSGIVRTVASLESDLKRVWNDAEALGRDLKELKVERDRSETRYRDELGKADRAQKQMHAQVRLANEQLEAQQERTRKAIADLESHVCQSNEHEIEEARTQHKNECKGLMVQIRYLKAKFTRESVFRADLGYQKHYLLDILSSFEKSEKHILAEIARIGFPLSRGQPHRKRPTLRTVAVVVLFIVKARRASEIWREQSAPRTAVTAALQDVRRRRIAGSLGYT